MVEKKTTKSRTTKPKVKAAPKAAPEKEKAVKAKAEATKPAVAHHPHGKYVYAVGRRKTSTAKVRLFTGQGDIFVNNKPLKDYLPWESWQREVMQPLTAVGAEKNFDVKAFVRGGGLHAQAGAVSLGIARALILKEETYRKVLRTQGLLTRDSRMKERKKPGLKRARRSPQWSKR